VDSQSVEFNGGIMNTRNRTAFIRGEIKNLKQLFTRAGQVLQGKIVKETSSEPFYPGQSPVANPNTGEVVMRNGAPFYQNYVFTTNLSESDREVQATTTPVVSGATAEKVA